MCSIFRKIIKAILKNRISFSHMKENYWGSLAMYKENCIVEIKNLKIKYVAGISSYCLVRRFFGGRRRLEWRKVRLLFLWTIESTFIVSISIRCGCRHGFVQRRLATLLHKISPSVIFFSSLNNFVTLFYDWPSFTILAWYDWLKVVYDLMWSCK